MCNDDLQSSLTLRLQPVSLALVLVFATELHGDFHACSHSTLRGPESLSLLTTVWGSFAYMAYIKMQDWLPYACCCP